MLDDMDPKHRALLALACAAEAMFEATCSALDEKMPGRGQENRRLINEGSAHLAISIQAGSGQIKAALALVAPKFVVVLEAPELVLQGSLQAVFNENATMTDLAKTN